MVFTCCGFGWAPSSSVAQECRGWLGVALTAQQELLCSHKVPMEKWPRFCTASRYRLEHVPATALLPVLPFLPFVSRLSRHHKFCIAVAEIWGRYYIIEFQFE